MTENDRPTTLVRHVAKGSAWTVSVRWASRLTGLVSTIILARLLSPADYGVVTIAMVIVATILVLNQTGGQYQAIIRHANPTREHYDAAWTIFIILTTVLAAAIWLAAPLAQVYFHEPRANAVVKVMALCTFIGGLENVGIVDFYRDLQFNKVFQYRTYPSFVAFFVGLVAAFALRNYWALVIGMLSENISRIALSYVLSPFRPRLSLRKATELWSFSIWTFFKSIGVYISSQIDRLAIGGFAGTAAMGRYEIASDLATAPSAEINQPMISVLFPVMSKAQHDRAALKDLYVNVLYWSILICSSSTVGIALVTNDMVDLVLGPKWVDAKSLLPWLALAYGAFGPSFTVYSTLDVIGKPHISARLAWLWAAALAAFIVVAAVAFKSVRAIAIARLLVSCIASPILFLIICRELGLRFADLAALLVRPFIASVIMALAVMWLESAIHPGLLRLCVCVFAGAVTYAGTILAFWRIMGSPKGLEATILDKARHFWTILRRFEWLGRSPTEVAAEPKGKVTVQQPDA